MGWRDEGRSIWFSNGEIEPPRNSYQEVISHEITITTNCLLEGLIYKDSVQD